MGNKNKIFYYKKNIQIKLKNNNNKTILCKMQILI